jgi:hypothetical protein
MLNNESSLNTRTRTFRSWILGHKGAHLETSPQTATQTCHHEKPYAGELNGESNCDVLML